MPSAVLRSALLLVTLTALAPRAGAATDTTAVTLATVTPPDSAAAAERDSATRARAAIPAIWRTHAEQSGYRRTATYDETIEYCRRLERGSPWVRLTSYGTSGQGRALPLLVVSKDRAFTPEAAARGGRTVVLIQNGIHSGEIEGKDASLELVRDLAVHKRRAELLDGVVLLVLPIFSVDAHERRGRWNRINQNGPEEMGWRSTPLGLNLNRDYLKAEAPEMKALLGNVFRTWRPHLLVDNHTTNGADYRHDLTYSFNHGPQNPRPIARWHLEAFEGRVLARLERMGHLTAPYFDFIDGEPAKGTKLDDSRPRYSTGYPPLHGRGAILVETHMLKPYDTRVRATYDLMLALLEELKGRPGELRAAVQASEIEIETRGRRNRGDAVALTTRATEKPTPFPYRGYVAVREPGAAAGGDVTRFTSAPWDTTIPIYRELVPHVTTPQPAGYFVGREWTKVRDLLELHGVRFHALRQAWRDTVEAQRIVTWHPDPTRREGHVPTIVDSLALERRVREFRPGDLWIPLDQPAGLVALHLLEARAPDGMLYWNAFDTILEKKEYAEAYVMEPVARRMLADDPALRREFEARVAADREFARDPAARLDFFYARSPWADPEWKVSPAYRALRPPPEFPTRR
jgi:hypothetical protein